MTSESIPVRERSEELKPCPFCGSATHPTVMPYEEEDWVPGYEVRCDDSGHDGQDGGRGCGGGSGWGETPDGAREAWNRRAESLVAAQPDACWFTVSNGEASLRISHPHFEGYTVCISFEKIEQDTASPSPGDSK